jgi:hypothetical protein
MGPRLYERIRNSQDCRRAKARTQIEKKKRQKKEKASHSQNVLHVPYDRHFAPAGNEVCGVNQLRSRTPSP